MNCRDVMNLHTSKSFGANAVELVSFRKCENSFEDRNSATAYALPV